MCSGDLPVTTGMQAEMGGQGMWLLKGILALYGEVPIKGPQGSLPLWCQVGEPRMGYFWCEHSGLSGQQARLLGIPRNSGLVLFWEPWSISESYM